MIKVVGRWDIGYVNTQDEYMKNWQFITKHFGVDQFCMTPNSGYGEQLKNDSVSGIQEVFEFDSIDDVLAANPTLVPIVIDERGTVPLRTFVHPENALYIFGRTGWSPIDHFGDRFQTVYIEAHNGVPDFGMFHPHQAASVVLYDRMVKLWQ